MSREYVYLSFFKTNKIDYIYRPDLSIIEFSCTNCQSIAYMCSQTSAWSCNKCSQTGNIINLIKYAQEGSFRNIYVPKKEQRSIIQMLERLSKKYPQETCVSSIKKKVSDLINYYEKTP